MPHKAIFVDLLTVDRVEGGQVVYENRLREGHGCVDFYQR